MACHVVSAAQAPFTVLNTHMIYGFIDRLETLLLSCFKRWTPVRLGMLGAISCNIKIVLRWIWEGLVINISDNQGYSPLQNL